MFATTIMHNAKFLAKWYFSYCEFSVASLSKLILNSFTVEGDRNKRMEDVIGLDSDAMTGICVCLNNPNKVLKNWRHLAKSPVLGIPDEVLRGCTPETPKSPTESLFEWIYGERSSLTIGQLCRALERIDRNDVVRDIKECFQRQPTSEQ